MISQLKKKVPPVHMRDAAVALDDAWGGAYDVKVGERHFVVRNPRTGKEVSVRHLPEYRSQDVTVPIPLSAPSVAGETPVFDWERAMRKSATLIMQSGRRCIRAHEGELRFGEAYGLVALSEGEQSFLGDGLMTSLRRQGYDFLLVGSVPEELLVVPVAKGWISAVLEFSLGHPACVDGVIAGCVFESRLGYLRGCLTHLGVPAGAIESDAPHKDPVTGRQVVDVRLRKAGLKAAGMCPERLGEHEILRLAKGLTCLLVPQHDFYELLAVESEYGTARVPIVTRMRPDTRLLRLQGGKPLCETRGAVMLEDAIG